MSWRRSATFGPLIPVFRARIFSMPYATSRYTLQHLHSQKLPSLCLCAQLTAWSHLRRAIVYVFLRTSSAIPMLRRQRRSTRKKSSSATQYTSSSATPKYP